MCLVTSTHSRTDVVADLACITHAYLSVVIIYHVFSEVMIFFVLEY